MIVAEFLKNRFNKGEDSNLFFYRDKSKHEVDIIEDLSLQIKAYEVKSAKRYNTDFFKNFDYLRNVIGDDKILSTRVIYDGNEDLDIDHNGIVNYRKLLAEHD